MTLHQKFFHLPTRPITRSSDHAHEDRSPENSSRPKFEGQLDFHYTERCPEKCGGNRIAIHAKRKSARLLYGEGRKEKKTRCLNNLEAETKETSQPANRHFAARSAVRHSDRRRN